MSWLEGIELHRCRAELLSATGETDEFGEAVLLDDGLMLEGFFAGSVGIRWVELSRLLENPLVRAKLGEADLERS